MRMGKDQIDRQAETHGGGLLTHTELLIALYLELVTAKDYGQARLVHALVQAEVEGGGRKYEAQ